MAWDAAEAGLKYVFTSALSSGFLLYGMALLYGATGSLSIDEIGRSLRDGVAVRSLAATGLVLVVIGLVLLLIGAFHPVGPRRWYY